MVRGEKLTRKWKLIKLSKMQRSDFASRFIEDFFDAIEGLPEIVQRYAMEYGLEKGHEVRRNINLKDFGEVAEFLGMISGTSVEKGRNAAVYSGCPAYMMTEVKESEVCRAFLLGFFSAFKMDVEVELNCGETCRVVVRPKKA